MDHVLISQAILGYVASSLILANLIGESPYASSTLYVQPIRECTGVDERQNHNGLSHDIGSDVQNQDYQVVLRLCNVLYVIAVDESYHIQLFYDNHTYCML